MMIFVEPLAKVTACGIPQGAQGWLPILNMPG